MANGPIVQSASGSYQVDERLTRGVISRRFWAYLVDLIVIAIWSAIVCVAIFMLGFLTFGLGWALFALVPLTAILYNAVTIGGSAQATVGMRFAGLKVVDAVTGGRPSGLAAAVHALLFYVAVSTFILWACDILLGLFRDDRRFAHDVLTGLMVIRAS
ncbi:RDD family protein [Microvirga antarctica]|uniref:RDD family protein n=1 Tax=Microvirga antarctica TaxID=2819233 RepID=UPI001B3092E4|nr:RDD family protein [Microvirga antarctica]